MGEKRLLGCQLAMIDDNPLEHIIMEKLCQQTLVFADITNHSDARPMLNRLKEVLPDALGLPDIILIDLHMPEFNGWDFLHFNALYDSLSKRVQVYESAG